MRLSNNAAVRVDQVRDFDVLHAGEGVDVAGTPAVDAGHAQADTVVGPDDLPDALVPEMANAAAIPPAAVCCRNARRVCRDMDDSL